MTLLFLSTLLNCITFYTNYYTDRCNYDGFAESDELAPPMPSSSIDDQRYANSNQLNLTLNRAIKAHGYFLIVAAQQRNTMKSSQIIRWPRRRSQRPVARKERITTPRPITNELL